MTPGSATGAYISPHVRGWAERIQVDGADADIEAALARVRPHAAGATQFEVITAAALAEFAARGVDVAVVEAGLGGRLDATNVLAARVVVLTNVALEHTEVLGDDPRGDRGGEARGRHARARSSCSASASGRALAREAGASRVDARLALEPRARRRCGRGVPRPRGRSGGRRGRPRARAGSSTAPSSRSRSGTARTTSPGSATCSGGFPTRRYTIVASILADKRPEEMLRALTPLGDTLVATESRNASR